jgi:hypothetical protein
MKHETNLQSSETGEPVYLEPEIAEFIDRLAAEKNATRSEIVNRLLKKDREIIEVIISMENMRS